MLLVKAFAAFAVVVLVIVLAAAWLLEYAVGYAMRHRR